MGDFDTDIGISNSDHKKLDQFCTLFNLKSLIEKETYITKSHKLTIVFILTNKAVFSKQQCYRNLFNDHQKLIATSVKSHFIKVDQKTVYYRNFKNFDENSFLNDPKEINFDLSTNDPNVNFSFITVLLLKMSNIMHF